MTGKQPKKKEKWRTKFQGNMEGLSEDKRDQFLSLVTEYEDIFAKEKLGKSGSKNMPLTRVIASH